MLTVFLHIFLCESFSFRAGTNVDCENLYNSLKNLHFEVAIKKDYKLSEMVAEVQESERKSSACDSLALICDSIFSR